MAWRLTITQNITNSPVKLISTFMVHYKNGNYHVIILPDGTKIRHTEEDEFYPVFPESIDVKVTNYCDLGCKYCHENSTIKGKHADLEALLKQIDLLPAGVELAIGGGNPLSWPDLSAFLVFAESKGLICNLTVNQGHLIQYRDEITELVSLGWVKGIGVSITQKSLFNTKWLTDISPHVVFHVIAGVNPINVLEQVKAFTDKPKTLILGYKTFGRGVGYKDSSVEGSLLEWKEKLPEYLGKQHLSFDNLALEQLEVQKLLPTEVWDKMYMGDDFTHTMYIDTVKQQYAPTSRSESRMSFSNMDVLEFFQNYKGGVTCEK